MDLNAAEEHVLERQGWFISGNVMPTAHMMVAGECVCLGTFESYLDAQLAINNVSKIVQDIATTLSLRAPAMMRG